MNWSAFWMSPSIVLNIFVMFFKLILLSYSKLAFLTRNSLLFNSKLTFLTRNSLFLLETHFSYSKLGKYCQQGNLASTSLREYEDSARHNEKVTFLSNTALHCGDLLTVIARSFHTVNSTGCIFVQQHKPGTAGSCPAHYPRYPPPVPVGGLEVLGAVVTNGLCIPLNKSNI